jgi:hypothetical protein
MTYNQFENYTTIKSLWAIPGVAAGAIFACGVFGEAFSGDMWGAAGSLLGLFISAGYVGHVNQTGSFMSYPPKPAAAK